jgi:hypothetical protein
MPSDLNRRFPPLRAWLWAIVWSTLFTGFFLATVRSSDSCFFLINSREYVWTITGLMWTWLCLFFLLGNRGRLGLLACTVLVTFPILQADRFPASAAEARAVVELSSMAQAVQAYRAEHPQQGYPDVLLKKPSDSLKKLYEIEYQTSRTKVGGPIDVFLIQVTPTWSECVVRSFAAAEDGKIHFVINRRPATKADPLL